MINEKKSLGLFSVVSLKFLVFPEYFISISIITY
jgi:hypothetical protein